MSAGKSILAFIPILFTVASAVEVELDFLVLPGSNATATFRVGTVLTATHVPTSSQAQQQTSISYGGNLLATADADPTDGTLRDFRFTGGGITRPNQSFVLQVSVGSVPFLINFTGTGWTRSATSAMPQEIVDGSLNNALHSAPFSGGSITVSNFRANQTTPTVTVTQNLAANPGTLASNAFVLEGNQANFLTVQEKSSTLLGGSYEATFFSPIAMGAVSPDAVIQAAGLAAGQNFKMRYSEIGSLSARASYTLRTAFGQWALDQGLALQTGRERNEAGLPYGLLFALGLPAESARTPLAFGSDRRSLFLTLPPEGLGFGLLVEYSPDLEAEWTPLDANLISGGLGKGQTGERVISFPEGMKGFLRLRVPALD